MSLLLNISPAVLQNIPPQQLISLRQKIEQYDLLEAQDRYEGSLYEFVKGAWPSIETVPFQSCWALEALADHLEAVTLGHIRRLLCNQPPRSSKTTIASICWPAWVWARAAKTYLSGPQVRFLCGSYSDRLSLMNSNKMRRLLLSPWYQRHWGDRFALTDDQNTKGAFDNTKGGSRFSTSVGGSLLGIGGDVVLIDDANNTETEKKIETDAERLRVKSWWKEISTTRLNDPHQSAIVAVAQRTHQGDLSGVMLDENDDDLVHLCIPMRHETGRHCVTVVLPQYADEEPWEDPRTKDGELMWPERFGDGEVRKLEHRLGPFMASGRLQQSPAPKGGGIIQREWWKPWDHIEAQKYGLEWAKNLKEFPHCELVIGSIDTAYGQKQENDFSAMTVWGIFLDQARNRRVVLMFAWAKRLRLNGQVLTALPNEPRVNFDQRQKAEWGLVEWAADTCRRYRVRRLLIEDKNRGRDVAQEINRQYARENWGVELVNPVGDKVSRLHSVVPLFTDNAVYAPDTAWAEAVISQTALVPKADHDDLADTTSQALWWMRERGILLMSDEQSMTLEDQMQLPTRQQSVAEIYGV